MNIAQIRQFDIANGPGIRASLFVSGCTHGCAGCFNQEYRKFDYGTAWSPELEDQFLTQLKAPQVKGVTILGGEPFDQVHDQDLQALLYRIKSETPHSIWIYSGYTFEEILANPARAAILSPCDVLVDGQFDITRKNLNLRFRGSENQRVIDVKPSLESGAPQLLEDY